MYSEVLWTLGAACTGIGLVALMSINSASDIALFDTYFVVSPLYAPAAILAVFVLYLVRDLRSRFRSILPCAILLTTGILLAHVLFNIAFMIASLPVSAWIIYPPLSALPDVVNNQNPVSDKQAMIRVIESFCLLIAIYCGILVHRIYRIYQFKNT
jgi:hypothetical protein